MTPGPSWDEDDRTDAPRIASNIAGLLASFDADAHLRMLPSETDQRSWHSHCYAGCSVPVAGYVGHFRGDPDVPELEDYEVGAGPRRQDGWPLRVGVWAVRVSETVEDLIDRTRSAIDVLDSSIPVGTRPRNEDELWSISALSAVLHGEWIRIHPYANGNGRTARLWVAWIAKRYTLPVFVNVRPKPGDPYARAAALSMGRPPNFRGDHAPTQHLFARYLYESLRP